MTSRWTTQKRTGFTIVELLVVIVVIAILAAIAILAYNGVQAKARDAQRNSDVATITKALEMYYVDNGQYPNGYGSTTMHSTNWSTTGDDSWQMLVDALVPKYISAIPSDPVSTTGANVTSDSSPGYNYAYYTPRSASNTNCGVPARQFYILVYRLESESQRDNLIGTCGGTKFGPYSGASNYRVVK